MFVYNYLFERDNIVSPAGRVFKQGDKVSYRSKSRNVVFHDGVIGKCYDSGLYISYGVDEVFNFGQFGTTKFIPLDRIDKLIGTRENRVAKLIKSKLDS